MGAFLLWDAVDDAKTSGSLSSPSHPQSLAGDTHAGTSNSGCKQEGAGEGAGAGAGGQEPSRLVSSHLQGQRPHGGGSSSAGVGAFTPQTRPVGARPQELVVEH